MLQFLSMGNVEQFVIQNIKVSILLIFRKVSRSGHWHIMYEYYFLNIKIDHQNTLLFACQYHKICWFFLLVFTACKLRQCRKHQGYCFNACYLHTTLICECLHGKHINVKFRTHWSRLGMLCCLLQRWFSCCSQDTTPRLTNFSKSSIELTQYKEYTVFSMVLNGTILWDTLILPYNPENSW